MWKGGREGMGGDGKYESHGDGLGYARDPPERDVGPDTSRNIILRDLRQMANDNSATDIDYELTRMKKLENIYALTNTPEMTLALQDANNYDSKLKEKKILLGDLAATNAHLQRHSNLGKNKFRAITDGGVGQSNSDVKLKDLERRIIEARKVVDARGMDAGIQGALHNYHDMFKQTMETIDNIAQMKSTHSLPKISNLQSFIAETEKNDFANGQEDAEITKALKELKQLNKYNTFQPNKLPYVPELSSSYEDDLAQLDITFNDLLDDLDDDGGLVEMPLKEFLKYAPTLESAKKIMRELEQ